MENFKITCPRCGQKAEAIPMDLGEPEISICCSVCESPLSEQELCWCMIHLLMIEVDILKRNAKILGPSLEWER